MPALAEIITVGDEILYGQTLDTNSHWIRQELDKAGIKALRETRIGDQRQEMRKLIEEAESRSDIILVTSGLGSTRDDMLTPCLVEYFDAKWVRKEEIQADISPLSSRFEQKITELTVNQAGLPEIGIPVNTISGTAVGMWFERNGKVLIYLPRVAYDMKKMMSDSIIPKLKNLFVTDVICHKVIRTIGISESKLAHVITDWASQLPGNIKLAYLPSIGTVKLRLTSWGAHRSDVETAVAQQAEKVVPLIRQYVYGYDEDEIEAVIGRLLTSSNKKLAIAESCTGGFLSHRVTSVPGSSEWFNGSFVSYSNQLKKEQLQVDQEVLERHGAVSEPVVLALAENVRKTFHADVAVSVSGIAGPGGGTEEKPVGTVWIGYADSTKTLAKKFQLSKDRTINIQHSATVALDMIRINLDSN